MAVKKIRCPRCDAVLTVDSAVVAGKSASCPKCQYRLKFKATNSGAKKKKKTEEISAAQQPSPSVSKKTASELPQNLPDFTARATTAGRNYRASSQRVSGSIVRILVASATGVLILSTAAWWMEQKKNEQREDTQQVVIQQTESSGNPGAASQHNSPNSFVRQNEVEPDRASVSAFPTDGNSTFGFPCTPVTLPNHYRSFALNPRTGDLAGVIRESRELHIYKAAELTKPNPTFERVKVNGAADVVAFRIVGDRTFCCVGGDQDSRLTIVELNGGHTQRKVILPTAAILDLESSSNPNDPWLFVATSTVRNGVLMAVNLLTDEICADCGRIDLPIRVSHTGRFLNSFRGLLRRQSVQEAPENLELIPSTSVSSEGVFTHHDQFRLHETMIYKLPSGARSKVIFLDRAQRNHYPVCAFNTVPVVATGMASYTTSNKQWGGAGEAMLTIASSNDFTSDTRLIPLKFDATLDQINPRDNQYERRIRFLRTINFFADDASKRIVCALSNTVYTVPLSLFTKADNELVKIPDLSRAATRPGREIRIPLKTNSSRVTTRVKGTLPLNSQLIDGELRLNPDVAQQGDVKLNVTIDTGKSHVDFPLNVQVYYPWAKLTPKPINDSLRQGIGRTLRH